MQNEPQGNYIRSVLMIIISAFCFACMNICIRLSGSLPSIQKSFFRNLVAACFAGIIIIKDNPQTHPLSLRIPRQARSALIWRCVFGTVGILCNFYAVDHLLVADASILNKLSPFFAVIFSYFLLQEKILPFQAGCIFSAFCGCLLIVKPGFHNAALLPALIGICGGLGAGIAYTMVRKLGMMKIKGPVIVFYFSLFSCLFLAPWIVINFAPMTLHQIITLLMTGLFAAGGQFSITAAYTYAPAKKISIFDYSQIIFAAALGFALFHEIPDKFSFIGYALVIAASLMMFLYNRRRDAN